jgi:hypothetical protein
MPAILSHPSIDREGIIRKYAELYVEEMYEHETLNEFCEQAALDLGDDSVKDRVRAAIKQMERRVAA